MRQLAIEGGKLLVRKPIPPLISIGPEEVRAVYDFLEKVAEGRATLSGYLAGSERGGPAVQRLEEAWCQEFGCRHAIACNSGTSALLAAYAVCGGERDFVMPTMGMSAIAGAAYVLGTHLVQNIRLLDVDSNFLLTGAQIEAGQFTIVSVNLFGQPTKIGYSYNEWIEDNAQAAWATIDGKYSGTLGAIGAWSFNVHKPTNAGEGGICTTNNDDIALALRYFINHGECANERETFAGLNLRMPELTAVLALAQMPRAKRIVKRRRQIAHGLGGKERAGCQSAWYCFPILLPSAKARDWAVKALIAEGVPARAGYMLIHKLPAFQHLNARCPNAEDLESRLVLLELCSIEPSDEQVKQMREAIEQVMKVCNA